MTAPRTRQRPGQATPDASRITATVIGPERTAGPRPTGGPETGGIEQQEAAGRWLVGEIDALVELLHAARLTAKAGHVPAVHLRRAAVRLVALDAAVTEDLALAVRADAEAVAS